MNLKEQIKVFLTFSKKERRGIYVLSVIAMLLWILPVFFSAETVPDEILEITPVQLDQAKKLLYARRDSFVNKRKYRTYSSGKTQKQENVSSREYSFSQEKPVAQGQQRKPAMVNLNEADSAMLEALPGIGERLSARIIKYRDRLGGFHDIGQLKEVYGLHDSVLAVLTSRVFIPAGSSVKKLAVNRCSYADFRHHPYVGHAFAKSLVAFRQTHGDVKSLEELYQLVAVKREEIDRMKPYFSFEKGENPNP